MDLAEVEKLFNAEINSISQSELIATIDEHKIPLRIESREWDYSNNFNEYQCCIVLEDKNTNTAVAYCNEGFGPSYPWGLLFLTGKHLSMGMDSAWFASLDDAVRESMLWHDENPENYEVQ